MLCTSSKQVSFLTLLSLRKSKKNHRESGRVSREVAPTQWCSSGPGTLKYSRQCGQVCCHGEAPSSFPAITNVDRILWCEGHRPLSSCHRAQLIKQHVYKEILWRLIRSVHDKTWELWQNNSRALHHDNYPCPLYQSIGEFMAQKNITVMEPPPYLPDLAPYDFFYFPMLKGVVKGTRFENVHFIKKLWLQSYEETRKNPSRNACKDGKVH